MPRAKRRLRHDRGPPALIVLPLPSPRRQSSSRRQTEKEVGVEHANCERAVAVRNGIDAIRAVIGLVLSQLTTQHRQVVAAKECLRTLEQELDELETMMATGECDEWTTMEGLGGLEEVLDCLPNIVENSQTFPWSMLGFWLCEIKRRGWELIFVAIGAVSCVDFNDASETLKNLRYPTDMTDTGGVREVLAGYGGLTSKA